MFYDSLAREMREVVVKELPIIGKAVDPKNKGFKRRAASAAKCAISYTGGMLVMYMVYKQPHDNKDSTQLAKEVAEMTAFMAAGMTMAKIYYNIAVRFGTQAYDCYVGKQVNTVDDLEMQSLTSQAPDLPAPSP